MMALDERWGPPKLFQFILRRTECVWGNFMAIHPIVVEIFHSKPLIMVALEEESEGQLSVGIQPLRIMNVQNVTVNLSNSCWGNSVWSKVDSGYAASTANNQNFKYLLIIWQSNTQTDAQSHLCNQKLDHVFHAFLNQLIYLGVELLLHKQGEVLTKHQFNRSFFLLVNIKLTNCGLNKAGAVRGEVLTSWPISMAHNLADWSLASTITLNMVHNVGEMRKSVDLLLFVSLDSNAILVLQCKWNIYTHYNIKHSVKVASVHSQVFLFLSVCLFHVHAHTHTHTAWRSSRSCCSTWAWCDSPGVWRTPPQASAGPWWKSGGRPASRRGPPTSRSHYCHRRRHTHTHRSEDKGHPAGERGWEEVDGRLLWQVQRRMLFLHTWTQSNFTPTIHWPVRPNVCLSSCLFRCLWTVSVWVKRSGQGLLQQINNHAAKYDYWPGCEVATCRYSHCRYSS